MSVYKCKYHINFVLKLDVPTKKESIIGQLNVYHFNNYYYLVDDFTGVAPYQ